MRIVFLGKNPTIGNCKGINALQYLLDNNIDVVRVVASENNIREYSLSKNLIVKDEKEVYNEIIKGKLNNIDLVISYGFPNLIKPPLITLGRKGCINFHPAPLPEWRGMGGVFNIGLYEKVQKWGVTCHYVDNSFDTGDIIQVNSFDINPKTNTLMDFTKKCQLETLNLFKEVIQLFISEKNIPRTPQQNGRYISKKYFNKIRNINLDDPIEEIDHKINSFWYPPYHGASIKIQDKEYSLVNSEILKELGKIIWNS
jgi:methionyl-tRNA formyltransferase